MLPGNASIASTTPVTLKSYSQDSFFALVYGGTGWICNWFAIGN